MVKPLSKKESDPCSISNRLGEPADSVVNNLSKLNVQLTEKQQIDLSDEINYIKHTSHFTIIFEYANGYVNVKHSDLLMFRGVSNGGMRPAYITIICNRDESTYVCAPETKQLIHYMDRLLTPGSSKYRIQVKPHWFNKLIL